MAFFQQNIILPKRVFILIYCVCFAGSMWSLRTTLYEVVRSLGRFGPGLFQLILMISEMTYLNGVIKIAGIGFFRMLYLLILIRS